MKSFLFKLYLKEFIYFKLLKESSKVEKENISKLMVSFSDPFRLEIIDLMMDGEVCVCDIMKLTNLSQSRISSVSYTHLTLPTILLV